ncbi:MAG: biotin/lipoyl-binding protein, partial [Rhodospirillales bacterium]|nr:biotin/lipoyl-binding protein [Rhodospirillales bacterium]
MSDRALAREAPPRARPAGLRPLAQRLRRPALLGGAALTLLIAALAGWHYWRVGRFVETTDDAYVGGDVTAIAPHVAGFVAAIPAADNALVPAGAVLVRLDDRDARAALARTEAALAARRAGVGAAAATLALQQATIRADTAALAG